MRVMLKSKIHRATVTDATLIMKGGQHYHDRNLMKARPDILPYEQVHVVDVNNGSRRRHLRHRRRKRRDLPKRAAARLVNKGDIVIILSYTNVLESELKDFHPTLVLC